MLRRWGRYRPPLLGPGLHVRLPAPVETVTKVEPDLVRRRPGRPGRRRRRARAGRSPGTPRTGRGATRRPCSSPATRTSSSWPAWSSTATPRRASPTSLFGVAAVEPSVAAAAEGVFREAVGRTPLEDDPGRRPPRVRGRGRARRLQARLDATGPAGRDRPGPGGRRPPAARGRPRLPRRLGGRLRRRALPQRGRGVRRRAALVGPGRGPGPPRRGRGPRRTSSRAAPRATSRAFLARPSAHAARPDLTEFRLLWDTLAVAFAGRPKLILDPRAGGRRHVWLADPDRLGLGRLLPPAPRVSPTTESS